jgi:hypothetical protein
MADDLPISESSVHTVQASVANGIVDRWVSAQSTAIPPEVVQFLENHTYLVPLLQEAPDIIRRYFGDVSCNYHLFTNPEDSSATTKLVLSIHPQMEPTAAYAAYRQFQRVWWTTILPQARGALIITPEYP